MCSESLLEQLVNAVAHTARARATASDTPQRPSQIVHERKARGVPDDTGQYMFIAIERVSTGGIRYSQQFQRQQTDGPTSASERAKKKRVRAEHCSRTKMLLPALGMQAGSEMRSGEDGRTQMQRTIGNVS